MILKGMSEVTIKLYRSIIQSHLKYKEYNNAQLNVIKLNTILQTQFSDETKQN